MTKSITKTTTIDTGRKRTVYGTDFPITKQIYKSGSKWICASVCNGIADSSEEFSTKKEALKYANA
jgi:predicted TIM-barrel fold metal-dependent hydrolase